MADEILSPFHKGREITLTPIQWSYLESIGGGNKSEGVRQLLLISAIDKAKSLGLQISENIDLQSLLVLIREFENGKNNC